MGLDWSADHEDRHRYILKLPGSGKTWWLWLLAGGTAVVLMVLLVGEKSLFTVWALQRESRDLNARIQALRLENQKLGLQISALQKDPKSVEWLAREELGFVRPDEIIYRFIPASPVDSKSAPEKPQR